MTSRANVLTFYAVSVDMKEATFSVFLIRKAIQYTATRGVDTKSLCAAINIDPSLLEVPDHRITGDINRAMWREIVKQTGDNNVGLHMGEEFNLASIGILGYVLYNCQTFNQVLEKLSRYWYLLSQGIYMHYSVSQGQVLCDCDIVSNLKNYLLEEPRQPIESILTSLLTLTKSITGKQLHLYAVWFQHPCPSDISEHQRIFGTNVQFSMPTNRMIFDANCLNWEVLSANPNLLLVFEQYAEAMLHKLSQQNTYTNTVVDAIAQKLKGEVPTIEVIANGLAISVRNLQRELQAEGTSYQQLLDETRKELAIRYLKKPNVMIHDVAFLLGFSEPSAFHRAFKRWTGKTPRAYKGQKIRN